MRPATFEPEIIIEAGKALQAEGRNVTAFALRSKIGGGNASRLRQVWDEFITSQTTITTEPVAELPVEVAEEVKHVSMSLTERINQLAIELNDKAVKAAERRVADVTRAAGEQTAQAERELADAAQTVDDLETELDESYANVSDLKQQLVESQLLAQHQAIELAQLKERLSVIEQAAKIESEQHKAIGEELTELKVRAATDAQVYVDYRTQIEQDLTRQAELLEQAKVDCDTARRESIEAREKIAKISGQLEAAHEQNASLFAVIKQIQDGNQLSSSIGSKLEEVSTGKKPRKKQS
ncbi:kfra protein [Photorhabdus stackebrandtii]|uniref:Kfra protein n=1 Tax=Photorhabdus stackebrandtii TaxID=1123042 RepID=A0A7X5TNH9_9GAMM|nr:DNA-binding protein [Photorhabdus stackebrandtii]NHB98749.1 kfra protein [Photorhabdus stackebrandtii]